MSIKIRSYKSADDFKLVGDFLFSILKGTFKYQEKIKLIAIENGHFDTNFS